MAELPVRHIVIGTEALRTLQNNVWSERYVQAWLAGSGGGRVPVRIRYRGGHTREYPKKSYEVVRGGRTYHYNAEYDDPSMIRNALSFQFFRWIGVPSPRTKHCLLYLNGESLGVYLEIEGVEDAFFRKRGIGAGPLFYAVNDDANFSLVKGDSNRRKASLLAGYQQMKGTVKDRERLRLFISRINTLRSKQLGMYIRQQLDVDNYLRWLAGAVLTGNYDGFDQNYAIYRHKTKLKYRMIPWDYEGTWGRNCYGKPCGSDLVRIQGYNKLTSKVLAFKVARSRYKTLLMQFLGTSFTVERIVPVAERMHESIRPHIIRDGARKWSVSDFDGETRFIRNYIQERRQLVQEALRNL
ncbi:CotH kinase family protein [Paenibacillus filicis]|uniref:CotH kinase family protein n=1 Tax=Paenibacillus gyeongsangnamensis TaxID=3388067 RepID=A0ABT4QCR5_9BACL|nr:CotH kinase family protein [Paenibacillus filicis]MCZ8514625.1 CotH kinase family protein [Paenibacillus filicis]